MSNSSDNLIMSLKLDTIDNNQALDSSKSQNKGTVSGGVTVVPDDSFGTCFNFDGIDDQVKVDPAKFASVTNNFTISFWVIPTTTIAKDIQATVGKTGTGGQRYAIFPNQGTVAYGGQEAGAGISVGTNGVSVYEHAANYLPPLLVWENNLSSSKWSHITVVYTNKQPSLYVNGQLVKTGSISSKNVHPSATIGGEAYGRFQGKIANVRIYNKALSLEEIKGDMDEDLSAIASFNKTHPLDFNLYQGEDKEPVIFIDNGTKEQELVLEICNNTDQPITLASKSGSATQDNYHFELRFRPDTLSPKSLQQLALKPQSNWSMSSPVTQADGIVSLYFLTTNSQALAANATATLTIQNINVTAEGGARTTRVQFLCPQFTYEGETLSNYYREKSLSIVNHRGKKNIPLHATFIGSNRILNDGKEQTLTLQIHNVLKGKNIDFNPINSKNPSRFILYFDVDTDWGLGTKSQVEAITVEVKDWKPGGNEEKDWDIRPEKQAQPTVAIEGLSAPYWVLTHQNVTEPVLAAGHTIQITLKIPDFSSVFGQTNLYIRYENIPGYWDGTFVCTIEKSPIVFDTNGNVGIGTSTPEFPLDVHSLRVRNGEYAAGNAWGRQIILTHKDSPISHVIRTRHSSGSGSGNAIDFYVWDPDNRSADGIGTLPTMTLDSGKVGIGTGINGLNNKLEVKGNAVIGSTYAGTRTAPPDDLLVEGTVTANKFVGEGAFVTGMIIMWSGSIDSIPTGWALCNGLNGTPDLRDRFILGTVDNSQRGQTGGESSHTHSMGNAGKHSHGFGGGGTMSLNTSAGNTTIYEALDHNHTINSASNLPPYYRMAFIMKT
ncbi:hypothetical protein H6F92_10840 [Microcystis wesenbergii FACHB-1317]|uniref:LamG-like jellyroll fold domain-containing protein n=1 Tax=Microcystis TaxID=1125 RepID=UPI0016816D47|nr:MULTISPECIES: LamG-like jellyroll fold domain-containing protein [Microcystis]MBD2289263.1 hypothetical protein [Microcystis wesenbergii FACHB-1317]UZO77727.1 hypothetical protein M8120_07305 [Microcystis aeruginosa str. Chao 1910]